VPDLLLFVAASAALTIAPGPDNLQVLMRGMSQGPGAGVAAALGFAAGCLFHTLLAAVGLAAVLRSSPVAFEAVKIAGGLYLVWIGIQALRSRGAFSLDAARAAAPRWAIFRQSVVGNMVNPKVTLFFLVFLPQFVDRDAGQPELQMVLLGLVFMLQTVVIFGAIGLAAGTIRSWLQRRPGAPLWLNRIAGVTFVLLGIRAAWPD
jgi:threonine/homoserine/homoserine lactone efflux protein